MIEPELPVYPRPRLCRCPECGKSVVVHQGRVAHHARAPLSQCEGVGAAVRDMHERDDPGGGR
jgi:hypothetical protein